MFLAISVNKGCHSHQLLQPPGNSGRKKYLPSTSHQTTATPHGEPWKNSGCENTGYWPQIAEMHLKAIISESKPRLLRLPIHRKVLNSLTWEFWFSLINNNLLMFRLSSLCCKTSVKPSSPLTSSEEFCQGYLKCCLPGSEVLKIPTK